MTEYLIDPLYSLTSPRICAQLPVSIWRKTVSSLCTRFEVSASVIHKLLPADSLIVQYGRLSRLEGGDVMQARDLIPAKEDTRDSSFVKVCCFSI